MVLREKIRFGISFRLSLIFFSVFILAIGIIYLYVVPQLESRLTRQKLDDLSDYATLYSENFYRAYDEGASPVYLDLMTQQYAERADARILLMDVSGNLISDSLKGQAFDSNDYPVASQAISTRKPATDVHTLENRNYAMAAVPLGTGNTVIQVVVVSSSMDDVESAVALVQRQLSVAAGSSLLISLVIIYTVAHFFSRRIRRLEAGAKKIAQGYFGTKVPVTAQDELGQLASTFNDMGGKLGSAFRQVDVEKRRAQLILDDLHEGVIGIDTGGNIIIANPAAEELLGLQLKPPVLFSECVPEEVFALWSSMSAANPEREDTFMLEGEKALQVHTSFIADQAELSSLVVLRDVSQEVKLDRSRRDFIANASHELKTPLFSLAGFLEILANEHVDEATKMEFLETMREQVERLTLLTHNLLDLSRVESGAIEVQRQPVHLKEVVESIVMEFAASMASDSRVDTGGVPADLVARGDRERTAQVMRILIDNALKYSPADTKVVVSGSGNGQNVRLMVEDKGPGISGEELPRIFERFYRGKSAGHVRGTGLGLSIAQELARLMSGDISVDSSEKGTVITVILPADRAK